MEQKEVHGIINSLNVNFEQSLHTLIAKAKASLPIHELIEIEKKYAVLDERKAKIKEEKGAINPQPHDSIKLNISGWKMEYNRRVLTHIQGSRLAGIFSGIWDKALPKDKSGRFFINENPSCFRYILNNLTGISSDRTLKEYEISIIDSICERYSLQDMRGIAVSDQNAMKGESSIKFPSTYDDFNSLKPPILELLETIHSYKKTLDNLTKQYELDVLNLEKDIEFVEQMIEDGTMVLELNVRGEIMATTKATLQTVPDSMLATKFDASKWTFQEDKDFDENGNIFIDVDPTAFRDVLDALRWNQLHGREEWRPLRAIEECEEDARQSTLSYLFPGKEGIFSWHHSKKIQFDCSELLVFEQQEKLVEWCRESSSLSRLSKGILLYRASKDGWSADDFHRKCDGKANTVIVISANGGIFGGFSDVSWQKSSPKYVSSNEVFLFSLVPPIGSEPREPTKLPLKSGHARFAVIHANTYLAAFGESHNLHIHQNANSSAGSYENLGSSFQIPSTFAGEPNTYFAGTNLFEIQEIECFMLENGGRS